MLNNQKIKSDVKPKIISLIEEIESENKKFENLDDYLASINKKIEDIKIQKKSELLAIQKEIDDALQSKNKAINDLKTQLAKEKDEQIQAYRSLKRQEISKIEEDIALKKKELQNLRTEIKNAKAEKSGKPIQIPAETKSAKIDSTPQNPLKMTETIGQKAPITLSNQETEKKEEIKPKLIEKPKKDTTNLNKLDSEIKRYLKNMKSLDKSMSSSKK